MKTKTKLKPKKIFLKLKLKIKTKITLPIGLTPDNFRPVAKTVIGIWALQCNFSVSSFTNFTTGNAIHLIHSLQNVVSKNGGAETSYKRAEMWKL